MIAVLAALATVLSASHAGLPQASPPGWTAALRCAGLTQAASELEGGESVRGRRLSDASLYWSLTANDAGAREGVAPAQIETAQTQARLRAVRELSENDPAARAALDRCLSDTPALG